MNKLIFFLCLLLSSYQALSQEFGMAIHCGTQGDFVGMTSFRGSYNIMGLGILHAGRLDLSLGIGYSYKRCSEEISLTTDISQGEEVYHLIHQMHFLNVPFIIEIRCWEHDRFSLKVFNELEYNRLCKHQQHIKNQPSVATIESWGAVPRSAANGLTYRLGLTAGYVLSGHCILNIAPFFGVKAILNQYEPQPLHFYVGETVRVPDHRCCSGIILGIEYRF